MLDLPLKPPLDLVWRGLSDARCAATWHSALQSRCVCVIGPVLGMESQLCVWHWAVLGIEYQYSTSTLGTQYAVIV